MFFFNENNVPIAATNLNPKIHLKMLINILFELNNYIRNKDSFYFNNYSQNCIYMACSHVSILLSTGDKMNNLKLF